MVQGWVHAAGTLPGDLVPLWAARCLPVMGSSASRRGPSFSCARCLGVVPAKPKLLPPFFCLSPSPHPPSPLSLLLLFLFLEQLQIPTPFPLLPAQTLGSRAVDADISSVSIAQQSPRRDTRMGTRGVHQTRSPQGMVTRHALAPAGRGWSSQPRG